MEPPPHPWPRTPPMPELPEITMYVEALRSRLVGETIVGVRLRSPSLLKTWEPPLSSVTGVGVQEVSRLGKRLVFALDGELFLVLHLMVTGRLRWRAPGAKVPAKGAHGAFDFTGGSLLLTEAGTKKRATLHLVRGAASLAAHHRGGVEPLEVGEAEFRSALLAGNRTLKRALTDPSLFSGIGGAHADEILWEAGLSPVQRTGNLDPDEVARLRAAARDHLERFTALLREELQGGFPEKVTAFHPAMAVHGRYRKPCPRCGAPVQRIVYAENETNYCAPCQTGGKVLADRSLSRLLREDWPRTLEAWEESPLSGGGESG